jgi:hypothetical protein
MPVAQKTIDRSKGTVGETAIQNNGKVPFMKRTTGAMVVRWRKRAWMSMATGGSFTATSACLLYFSTNCVNWGACAPSRRSIKAPFYAIKNSYCETLGNRIEVYVCIKVQYKYRRRLELCGR